MDDKARFDQLEEIIVELLRKQDRTMEELAFLREAVSELSNTLVRMHNDLVRINSETATTRRLANDTVRLLHSLERDLTTATQRHDRLFDETAALLVEQHVEMKEFRQEFAEFQTETRAIFAQNAEFQTETRASFAQNAEFQTETRAAQARTETTLDKILAMLANPSK